MDLLELGHFGEEPAPLGVQHAALGVREAGQVDAGEILERGLQGVQARGQPRRRGPERRSALVGGRRQRRAGVALEGLAGDVVGHDAVGGQEGRGLPACERVAQEDFRELHLLGLPERREGQGRGEAERPVVEAEAQRRGETAGQRQAPLDPGFLLAEDLAGGRDGEPVVLDQRSGDEGLVHGTDRPRRSVRRQEAGLHRHARGPLDHHGHFRSALGDPDRQALEAVDHLVDAVAGGGDTERERREEGRLVSALAAKDTEARLDPVDGDELDEVHGRSSTGRIWKSGYR